MPKELTFTIRAATAGDTEGILACLREAFEPFRARYTPGAWLDTVLTPETLRARFAEMTVLVATDPGGAVIGTISHLRLSPDEGHVRGMAVRPGWQGRGVAQALLESAEEGIRRDGCARVSLDTTEPLRRAIRFYERNGFTPTGRISEFFDMPLFEYVKSLR